MWPWYWCFLLMMSRHLFWSRFIHLHKLISDCFMVMHWLSLSCMWTTSWLHLTIIIAPHHLCFRSVSVMVTGDMASNPHWSGIHILYSQYCKAHWRDVKLYPNKFYGEQCKVFASDLNSLLKTSFKTGVYWTDDWTTFPLPFEIVCSSAWSACIEHYPEYVLACSGWHSANQLERFHSVIFTALKCQISTEHSSAHTRNLICSRVRQ